TTVPDFATFGVMPFFDMLIDRQQAIGVRGLFWLFGTFAHGHYLATIWKVSIEAWGQPSPTNDPALYQKRPLKRKNAARAAFFLFAMNLVLCFVDDFVSADPRHHRAQLLADDFDTVSGVVT